MTNAGKIAACRLQRGKKDERIQASREKPRNLQRSARKQQELKRIGILQQRRTCFVEGEGPQIVRHGVF
jgi:hypothetical protein